MVTQRHTLRALYRKNLRRIRKGFGHRSIKSTHNLLKKSSIHELKVGTMRKLKNISVDCSTCKENTPSIRSFRPSVRRDHFKFNHLVIVDTIFINGRPILNMVDDSTRNQAVSFLISQFKNKIWK